VLKSQGRYDEAERAYREIVDRFPDNVFARNGLAFILAAQGKSEEAEAGYRDVLNRDSRNVYARVGLARMLLQSGAGSRDEAVQLLEQALEIQPWDTLVRERLDALRGSTPEADEEEEAWNRFFEQDLETSNHGQSDVISDEPRTTGGAQEPVTVDFEAKTGQPSVDAEIESPAVSASQSDTAPLNQVDEDEHPAKSFAQAELDAKATAVEKAELPADAQLLLTDSLVLRRWSRRLEPEAQKSAPGEWQQRGRELIEKLKPLWRQDGEIAGEVGLLSVLEGDLEEAVQLLRQAADRFRGSTWVRFALGRAERELAHAEQRRLSDEAERQVINPWKGLGRADEQLVPVQNLGSGRAWLSLTDGATVENNAKDSFGKLAHWVRNFIQPAEATPQRLDESVESLLQSFEPQPKVDSFTGWWAREVQICVFDRDDIARADDLDDNRYAALLSRLDRNAATLDALEEEFVRRIARA
jgi:tetratricopeptide (TPR) repeat protein